jgi:hypothetical protein
VAGTARRFHSPRIGNPRGIDIKSVGVLPRGTR